METIKTWQQRSEEALAHEAYYSGTRKTEIVMDALRAENADLRAALASIPAQTGIDSVLPPKLILALPDYEKRRIVIASDDTEDGERLVCVAIEPAGIDSAPVAQDERAAFEAWARKECNVPADVHLNFDGDWSKAAWEGWQASLASQAQQEPIGYAPTYILDRFAAGDPSAMCTITRKPLPGHGVTLALYATPQPAAPAQQVVVPRERLQNWIDMIHDNERTMGDRLQSLSSTFAGLLNGDAVDRYPLCAIREQRQDAVVSAPAVPAPEPDACGICAGTLTAFGKRCVCVEKG